MSKGKKHYKTRQFAMPITEHGFVDAFLGATDTGNKQRMIDRLMAGGYAPQTVAAIFRRVINSPNAEKVAKPFRDKMGVWLRENGFNTSVAA